MVAPTSPTNHDERDWYALVLGIGNVLYADEGFGVRALEALNAQYRFPSNVRVMDGGTQGIFLLPWVRSTERLLILDAIDFGLAPGELRMIRDDDVPCFMGAKKVSMHQAGFQEVLACAALSGDYPRHLALVGVQPEILDDYGGSLTAKVKARIPEAVALARQVLDEWGVARVERNLPLQPGESTGPGAVEMDCYELGRPRPGAGTVGMYHPLVQSLIEDCHYPEITLENHDAFINQPGVRVLYFVGDPKRNRESTDVAVVLPELVEAFGGQLQPGVVAEYSTIGVELERRYGFRKWPALVFLRDGGYLGAISGIRNWADYLQTIPELLSAEPHRSPGFKIPVVVEAQ